ncbi:ExbD/TolR family protein [Lignipirellula cremea]|uniref:Colicin uptake protein TolR n=1 Tax=Lignipirellula cremea TaxID=2528010 RepID=A0A518DST1_9BACT|nr:biopolymer transporter ExbD [Lignipirellula cremea]QDU94895.1 colicin uptake protein TolR [Lignipirellula cremea]
MRLSSRKSSRQTEIELSMTSMIDVVFLLLIFFMTTASFVKTERDLDSAIKVQSQSKRPSDLEPTVVKIARGSGGQYAFLVGAHELTTQVELTDLVTQLGNKDAGAFVQAGDGAPFHMVAAAIQACKDAGYRPVSYTPIP